MDTSGENFTDNIYWILHLNVSIFTGAVMDSTTIFINHTLLTSRTLKDANNSTHWLRNARIVWDLWIIDISWFSWKCSLLWKILRNGTISKFRLIKFYSELLYSLYSFRVGHKKRVFQQVSYVRGIYTRTSETYFPPFPPCFCGPSRGSTLKKVYLQVTLIALLLGVQSCISRRLTLSKRNQINPITQSWNVEKYTSFLDNRKIVNIGFGRFLWTEWSD